MQPASIGPYALEAELGRGGTGVVFRARAPDGRLVALKLLTATRPEAWARFEREVRIQRELAAEGGFVAVLDYGRDPRGPFLVQELVPGGTLRERLRGPWPALDVVELGVALATALGRAHALGVVHRDVKPDNVLFDAHGRALLVDLGLAKHVAGDTGGLGLSRSLSVDGELRGTAGYMAPEQMADAKSVDARGDVFACGAILYECAAGQPAFSGHGPLEVIEAATQGRRVPLRRLRPDLPAALVAAIERCLALDPAARHADGAALAKELAAVDLAPSSLRRAWRALTALAVCASVGLAALLLGAPAADEPAAAPVDPPAVSEAHLPGAAHPDLDPAPADPPAGEAPPEVREGGTAPVPVAPSPALEAANGGGSPAPLVLTERDEGGAPPGGDPERPGLLGELAPLELLEPLEQLGRADTKHVAPLRSVAVDSGGRGYAIDGRGWLRAYTLPSGAELGVVRPGERGGPAGPALVSPDGTKLAWTEADRNGLGRIISLRGGRGLELTGAERVSAFAWTRSSAVLAVAHERAVSLVNVVKRDTVPLLSLDAPATAVAFSPRLAKVVIVTAEGDLIAFQGERTPFQRSKIGRHQQAHAVALAPDGAFAASGGGGVLGLWDAQALELRSRRELRAGELLELRFVGERRLLALCERAAVWLDAESGAEERRVRFLTPLALAASTFDGRAALGVGGKATRLRFFDLEGRRETPAVRGHGGAVVATAPSPRGVLTLDEGGDTLTWRDGTSYLIGPALMALRATAPPRALATLGEGRATLVVTGRGEPHLLDVANARTARVSSVGGVAHAAASTPDDDFLLMGEDGVLRRLDPSGRTTRSWQAHAVAGERVLAGDGGLLTLGRGAAGPEAALWRAGALVNRFAVVPAQAAVRLEPGGLALGGPDGALTLFDLSDGSASAHVEQAHPGGVLALGTDPAGRLLLSSGEDGSLACWEVTAEGLRLRERAELATTRDLIVSISPLRHQGRPAVALGSARGVVVICGWR